MIPADLRSAFGKTEFKQALNTKDENEAIRIGAPILADWNDQIAAAAKRSALAVAPVQRHGIDRDRAHDAIKRWKSARLKAALNEAFNGGLDPAPVGFSDEMRAHVQMVGDLRAGEWSDVPDFDAKLAAALNSQGVMCDPLHPAIPNIRPWFCAALARVEHGIMEYRKGNLTDAPEPPPLARPALVAVEGSFTGPAAPKAGMKLLALFDLWESSKGRSERRHRGYVQRLVEYLGDPDIDTVTALQMDAFLVELRKFPNTKRPIDKTPFAEAIAESAGRSDYRTLHTKTVWNWTIVYKALFEFAVDRDLIRKNPAAKMMKRPSPEESDERAAYDADDVKAIFGANLFNGFSGNGYGASPEGGMSPQSRRFNRRTLWKLRGLDVPMMSVRWANFHESLARHPDVFAYLDPPYLLPQNRNYYRPNFDHDQFFEAIKDRPNWVQSNADNQLVRERYAGFRLVPLEWAYGTRRGSSELLIFSR